MNGQSTAPETPARMESENAGYYGRPMIKPPEWTDLIPVYFWAGGASGAAATLALTQRVRRNDALATPLIFGAAAGCVVSGACLILDLKRPERFHHMLRVFKPTSPMSMGVYIFSIFGSATMTAALCELAGAAKPLGRLAELVAGVSGPLMSVYTAVLISDTVVPAWYLARKSLPALFAATSGANAGALGVLFGPAKASGSARRLAIAGGLAIPLALHAVHKDVGTFQAKAYEEGQAGSLAHVSRALNLGGVACLVLGGKVPLLARAGAAMVLAAGLAERFAVMRAGSNSAKDPAYTINAQQQPATATP